MLDDVVVGVCDLENCDGVGGGGIVGEVIVLDVFLVEFVESEEVVFDEFEVCFGIGCVD